MPKGDLLELPKGEIGSDIFLEPNKSKSGLLVFIEEFRNNEELARVFKVVKELFTENELILTDTHGREYVYPVKPESMTWK